MNFDRAIGFAAVRGALIYIVVAGSFMVVSQFIVLSTALSRNATATIPWMAVLSLVVAMPVSLFILQRTRDSSRRQALAPREAVRRDHAGHRS